MHLHMIIFGLLHATVLTVVAFFVWFAAARATGWLKRLGTILGGWLILLAILGILFAAFAPAGMGRHHMGGWMAAPAPTVTPTNSTP